MIPRIIDLPFGKHSFFLFGPRQTGKSTLVNSRIRDLRHLCLDLLKRDVFLKYRLEPGIFRSEIEYLVKREQEVLTVFVDEIQKLPLLLDEVHYLLERFKGRIHFVLTGSSARKLKRAKVNMLAGRAWEFRLYPLTFLELGNSFDLNQVLLKGSLPPVIGQNNQDAFRTLHAYCRTYLKEEIMDEALVRNVEAFSRFLDIAADQSGSIVNYSTIARETGTSSKTIKAYYQILEDTLIAFRLEPYLKSARKRLIRHPKYYLFDTGVVNSLCGRWTAASIKTPSVFGFLFEHFIVLETQRLFAYKRPFARLYHWRSASGAEVDLVIQEPERIRAVEIKSSKMVKASALRGLRSFCREHPEAEPVCVSMCDMPYYAGEIPVLPWMEYFRELGLSEQRDRG